jgi:hypothetical protein
MLIDNNYNTTLFLYDGIYFNNIIWEPVNIVLEELIEDYVIDYIIGKWKR